MPASEFESNKNLVPAAAGLHKVNLRMYTESQKETKQLDRVHSYRQQAPLKTGVCEALLGL